MADAQEALSLGYLYKLHFCVAKDSDAINMIESDSYIFSCNASGEVQGAVQHGRMHAVLASSCACIVSGQYNSAQ